MKISNAAKTCPDISIKFDPQLLLERQSLNETWNKLMKSGVLSSDQACTFFDSVNNRTIGSPSGNFPCACCDGECDLKCQTLSQSPNSFPPYLERSLNKLLTSFTWNKDAGKWQNNQV